MSMSCDLIGFHMAIPHIYRPFMKCLNQVPSPRWCMVSQNHIMNIFSVILFWVAGQSMKTCCDKELKMTQYFDNIVDVELYEKIMIAI